MFSIKKTTLDNDNVIFGWDVDNIVNFNQIEKIEATDAEDHVNDANNPAPYETNRNANDDHDPDENVVTDDESSIEVDESFSVDEVDEHNQQPENQYVIEPDIQLNEEDENDINENNIEHVSESSDSDEFDKSRSDADLNDIIDDDSIKHIENHLTIVDDSIFDRIDDLEEEIREDIRKSENLFNADESDVSGNDYLSDESVIEETIATIRPRRENAGTGVIRFEPDFSSKTYKSSRHIQLLMKADSSNASNESMTTTRSYMSRAVNVLFTQMSATEGIKKHGGKAIAILSK